jgi:hypothetical protein
MTESASGVSFCQKQAQSVLLEVQKWQLQPPLPLQCVWIVSEVAISLL